MALVVVQGYLQDYTMVLGLGGFAWGACRHIQIIDMLMTLLVDLYLSFIHLFLGRKCHSLSFEYKLSFLNTVFCNVFLEQLINDHIDK